MLGIVLVLSFLSVSFSYLPSDGKVYASLKDLSVDGMEGFNVSFAAPFKFNDFVVGFKYALGTVNNKPESIFAKRTFERVFSGRGEVGVDYNVQKQDVDMTAYWKSKKYGLNLFANGNHRTGITAVEGHKSARLGGNKFWLKGLYDVVNKKYVGSASVDIDSCQLQLRIDEKTEPVLTLTKRLSYSDEIVPAVALTTGKLSFGYNRRWYGGSVRSTLSPEDKLLDIEWIDKGSSGKWITRAIIPLEGSGSKISIGRYWNY